MIYPPGFDPTQEYQEIEFKGHVIVCYSPTALPLIFESPAMRALARLDPMSEKVWFEELDANASTGHNGLESYPPWPYRK